MTRGIHSRNGFTLIELLVVIAIIGILSAVVLASLSTARDKGTDAAIISNLTTIQTQAELYYSNGSTYGQQISTGNCRPGNIDGMFRTTAPLGDPVVLRTITATESMNGPITGPTSGGMRCGVNSNGGLYAVQSPLVTDPSKYWCVDSSGNSGQSSTELGLGEWVCPP
jgi:prepilin-type N-terminal cleavage/methylation domain-containing protein